MYPEYIGGQFIPENAEANRRAREAIMVVCCCYCEQRLIISECNTHQMVEDE